jgi:hypothetical protein
MQMEPPPRTRKPPARCSARRSSSAFCWAVVVRGTFGLCFVICRATFDFSAVTKVVGDFRFCTGRSSLSRFLRGPLLQRGGRLGYFRRASSAVLASAARRVASARSTSCSRARRRSSYARFVRLGRATSGAWSVASREGIDAGIVYHARCSGTALLWLSRPLSFSPRLAVARGAPTVHGAWALRGVDRDCRGGEEQAGEDGVAQESNRGPSWHTRVDLIRGTPGPPV